MLCDRPGIEVSRDVGGGGAEGAMPFLSAVSAPEQLGLNPIKKEHLNSSKGTTKPKNVVLSNHKRWLHSLQMLKRQLADEEEFMAEQDEMKKKRLAEESKKVRDHIRQIKEEMINPADAEGISSQQAAEMKDGMLSELKGKFGRELVEEMYDRSGHGGEEYQYQEAPMAATQPVRTARTAKSSKSVSRQKPAWARTEEQEAEAEEDEVEDLLEFAESLDIDKYMDDYEFNEALAAAKARITELDEEDEGAEAGDDDDNRSQGTVGTAMTGMSTMSQRLRARAEKEENGEDEWDNRTQGSNESARTRTSTKSRAVAAEMLEMNPNLRKIHSTKSLARVVEEVDEGQFDPADQNKFGRCGAGAVRVAVHNDEDRLHRLDIKEGKDLPYLYRNPAV